MLKKVPIYKINKFERLWLESVYEIIKTNKRPSNREITTKLYNQIPPNFHPVNMNRDIISADGERITLLGVVAVEKNYKVLEKVNRIINTIRDILLKDSSVKDIHSKDIAEKANIEDNEVQILLNFIFEYRGFYQSAGMGGAGTYGIVNFHIEDTYFYRYISFESIEKLILLSLEEEKNQQKNLENFKSGNLQKPIFENDKKAIESIFKSSISHVDEKLCFAIMPFTETWSDNVFSLIRENIENLGLQCIRADNSFGPIVIEDIWVKINQAAFVIADVTGKNPNVMYELGIAHALSKPVILLTQDMMNIPFDLKHLRHQEYKNDLGGSKVFSQKLLPAIADIYQKYYPKIKMKNRSKK